MAKVLNIKGVSKDLSTSIQHLLDYDSYRASRSSGHDKNVVKPGKKAEKYLTSLGLIDSKGNFEDPKNLKGELKIAAKWLHKNV